MSNQILACENLCELWFLCAALGNRIYAYMHELMNQCSTCVNHDLLCTRGWFTRRAGRARVFLRPDLGQADSLGTHAHASS